MHSLPKSTAKDVFSQLLAIITLYAAVIAFIALWFQYINVKFPDVLQYYFAGSLNIIRTSMAVLIVIWPVCVGISWFIERERRQESEKREVGIRKWLLYLTLFGTAITIIIDLVTLVNYFLNGEITPRFLLKVLVVLITAAAVFGYYLWDLRRHTTTSRIPKNSAIVGTLVIVASIVIGFFLVGLPGDQRNVRLDEQRVQDLSMIQAEITNYYQQTGLLPESIDELTTRTTGFVIPVDPVTHAAYAYQVVNPDVDVKPAGSLQSFELCATFAAKSIPDVYTHVYGQTWDHDAGYACFTRNVSPSMYPRIESAPPLGVKMMP